ncbi:MAG: histidine kinase N-terminal 7TM domain-containing protein [Chloroflexota bacterium]
MYWRLAFISIALTTGTLITLALAYLAWTRRRGIGAWPFMAMMASISFWSFCYTLEQFTPILEEKIFLHKMTYIGVPLVPISWFIFNAQVLKFRFAKSAFWIGVLSIIPVVTIILTWTLEYHDLIWKEFAIESKGGLHLLVVERNPEYFIYAGYSYLLLLLGTIGFIKVLLQSPSFRLSTVSILVLAVIIGLLFNVLRVVFAIDLTGDYDLSPLTLATIGGTAGWFVFRFGPLDVLSVAHLAMYENMNDGCIVTGLSGQIVSINEAALKLLSTSENQALGITVYDLMPPGHHCLSPEQTDLLHELATQVDYYSVSRNNTQQTHFEIVFPEVSPVAEDIYVDLTINHLFDRQGRPRGSLFILRDISQRKRTQEALIQAQRLESTGLFAGGVAHDFNNLLAAIQMRHQLALNQLQNYPSMTHPHIEQPQVIEQLPPEWHSLIQPAIRHIDIAENAVQRASDLTRQLLAYTGKGHFKIEPVDVNHLIVENKALLATAIPKEIDLRITLSPSSLYVDADRGQLQQVIMNLVLNAVEATEGKEGKIDVHTKLRHVDIDDAKQFIWKSNPQPGTYVQLVVRDSGAGMLPEIQARIFDPFFTTKVDGRGLGLSAALGAIHLYNGGIQVSSRQDRGTVFRTLFPLSDAAIHRYDRSGQEEKPNDTTQFTGTILIADDEPPILDVLSEILMDSGLNVLTAANGKEAVEIFQINQEQINLVLLDTKMPIMGGIESLEIMRRIRPELSALLSSGYSEHEISLAVRWDKQTDFLQKPYDIEILTQKIELLLCQTPRKVELVNKL